MQTHIWHSDPLLKDLTIFVLKFADDYPKLTKMYMSEDIDPTPIENEIQDLKRTEYLCKYCSRG
jgi:hypothetical protein